MTLWRVLTVFFGLLITAPTVILNANGYNIAFWVDDAARVTTTANVEQSTALPAPIVPPRDRPDVQAMFTTENLTAARVIKITEVIADTDLLLNGEAMPDDTLLPLYAAARTPARLIQYCTEVIATIGTTCDVIHSEAQQNQNGKWELTGHLAFIPAFDTGNPYDMEDGTFVEASIDLPHDGDLLPANDAATRKDAIAQIKSLCIQLREVVGNCAVAQVTFAVNELWITDLEALPPGTNPQRLAVQARFAVFADTTGPDEAGLLELLQNLTGPA